MGGGGDTEIYIIRTLGYSQTGAGCLLQASMLVSSLQEAANKNAHTGSIGARGNARFIDTSPEISVLGVSEMTKTNVHMTPRRNLKKNTSWQRIGNHRKNYNGTIDYDVN